MTRCFLGGTAGMLGVGDWYSYPILGVPEKAIQAILRHANVSTTNTYYIKSAADDTRAAMAKLEKFVIGNAEATNLQSGNSRDRGSNYLNAVNTLFTVV